LENKYKSWSNLKKRLEQEFLCEKLRKRVDYFLTSYHNVHNCCGRASVRIDKIDVVCFSWDKEFQQHQDMWQYKKNETKSNHINWDDIYVIHQDEWYEKGVICDGEFIEAVLIFLKTPIEEAIASKNLLIKLLAIVDRRIGKRRLVELKDKGDYLNYPNWLKQFYELRFYVEGV
jgi:hypothetical protein